MEFVLVMDFALTGVLASASFGVDVWPIWDLL
jgi:hypothetical protein